MIARLVDVVAIALVAAVAGGLADGALAAWAAGHLDRGHGNLALAEVAASLQGWLRAGLPAIAGAGTLAVLARDPREPLPIRPAAWGTIFVAAYAVIAGTTGLPDPRTLGGSPALSAIAQEIARIAGAGALTVVAAALWRRAGGVPGRRPAWIAVAVVAVVAAAAVFGATRAHLAQATERPNVLVLVIDSLRADRLGRHGDEQLTTPFLDTLVKRAVVFDQAMSAAPWTKPSVASMWTGVYAERHGADDPERALPAEFVGLHEHLRNAGYATWLLNGGNPWLAAGFGFERGFDHVVAPDERRAGRLNEALLDLLRSRDRNRPFFAYVHYMDLHLPYPDNRFNGALRRPPWVDEGLLPGEVTARPVRTRNYLGRLGPRQRQWLRNLYDAQVRFVDSQLARLFEALDGMGLQDETWIVVTADHGEELWDHGNYAHGHSLHQEVIRVPLLVLGPGREPSRIDAPVSLVDLAPTVLGWAGVADHGTAFDGVDLWADGGAVTADERSIHSSGILYGPRRYAVRRGHWKAIHNTADDRGTWHLVGARSHDPWQLFDLAADPTETTNLSVTAPETRADLAVELEAMRSQGPWATGPAAKLDSELRDRLRALGYVP